MLDAIKLAMIFVGAIGFAFLIITRKSKPWPIELKQIDPKRPENQQKSGDKLPHSK